MWIVVRPDKYKRNRVFFRALDWRMAWRAYRSLPRDRREWYLTRTYRG